jgi:hypothetical protein
MKCAPIALFAYNRPFHLRQTVEALQKNDLASTSHLHIFCDSANSPVNQQSVQGVRTYAKTVAGFAKVFTREQTRNLGLANSIISGVTNLAGEHGRVIVLEDDLVTSRWFLRFMNEGLAFYADEPRVASIHGYVYPVNDELPETFFIRGADCWGWATWDRAWACFNSDAGALLERLRELQLEQSFDYGGAAQNVRMLKEYLAGQNDSWAIRWHASTFIANKLTLYPGRSLVRNIGFDGSGTHCKTQSNDHDVELAQRPVTIEPIRLEENETSRKLFQRFFAHLSRACA